MLALIMSPNKSNTVLLVGTESDPHVIRVAEQCRSLNAATHVFDRHNSQHTLSLEVSTSGLSGVLSLGDETVGLGEIDAVWWRVKPFTPSEYNGVPANITEAFIMREWRNTLKSLSSFLSNAFWVNETANHDLIALKPRQLAIAQSVGLRIPSTLFTNDPHRAVQFARSNPRIIYKVISSYFTVPRYDNTETCGETIYTTEIGEELVANSARRIRQAPIQLQELVPKQYELRINVVGSRMFAARIDSQADPSTSLDWRHCQLNDMYTCTEVGDPLKEKLLAFHSKAGLFMAAYDLIVPAGGGEPVFLECNAGGQWLWIEERLKQPITGELCSHLARGRF